MLNMNHGATLIIEQHIAPNSIANIVVLFQKFTTSQNYMFQERVIEGIPLIYTIGYLLLLPLTTSILHSCSTGSLARITSAVSCKAPWSARGVCISYGVLRHVESPRIIVVWWTPQLSMPLQISIGIHVLALPKLAVQSQGVKFSTLHCSYSPLHGLPMKAYSLFCQW